MFAVGLGFIGLLVFVNDRRADDDAAAVTEPIRSRAAGGDRRLPPRRRQLDASTVETEPTIEAVSTTVDPRIADLPAPGTVRVGPDDYEIVARCEVHLPFDPVDTETQLSSYFFFDGNGERGLVERRVDGSSDSATRLVSGTFTSTAEVSEIGDAGAFVGVVRRWRRRGQPGDDRRNAVWRPCRHERTRTVRRAAHPDHSRRLRRDGRSDGDDDLRTHLRGQPVRDPPGGRRARRDRLRTRTR